MLTVPGQQGVTGLEEVCTTYRVFFCLRAFLLTSIVNTLPPASNASRWERRSLHLHQHSVGETLFTSPIIIIAIVILTPAHTATKAIQSHHLVVFSTIPQETGVRLLRAHSYSPHIEGRDAHVRQTSLFLLQGSKDTALPLIRWYSSIFI